MPAKGVPVNTPISLRIALYPWRPNHLRKTRGCLIQPAQKGTSGGGPVAVATIAQRFIGHPRDPTALPLWRCCDADYDIFHHNDPATFRNSHGFFRPVVEEVVEDYLECGDLQNGFARTPLTPS